MSKDDTNIDLMEKWAPVLNAESAEAIENPHIKAVTARLLENTERSLVEERAESSFMAEAPANATGSAIAGWDPVLISLVRRAMPKLLAFDLAGVQPMTMPTGLIFAMKSRYSTQTGDEALFGEADSAFSGTGTHAGSTDSLGSAGTDTSPDDDIEDSFDKGVGMSTAAGEALGSGGGGTFGEMAFSLDKTMVEAKTRALKAEYTMELAQDLKAVHGLNAETELANILSTQIIAEINSETVRTINSKAKLGCQQSGLANPGQFDLSVDADGRWSVEKFKGLLVQIQRECGQIAAETWRGRGNMIVVSSDVAAAFSATGLLDNTPALSGNGSISNDVSGASFVGVLKGAGNVRVFLDPYATVNYINCGYKGSSAYDAGLFYCPYVPMTMVRAVGENTFQPKIGFKTRYGMVANPFAGNPSDDSGKGADRSNQYYRIFEVKNILTGA